MERYNFDTTEALFKFIEKNVSDDVIFVVIMDKLGILVIKK